MKKLMLIGATIVVGLVSFLVVEATFYSGNWTDSNGQFAMNGALTITFVEKDYNGNPISFSYTCYQADAKCWVITLTGLRLYDAVEGETEAAPSWAEPDNGTITKLP